MWIVVKIGLSFIRAFRALSTVFGMSYNFKSMNVRFYFLLFAISPIYGCFLPVSTMFESAHSLEPGEINLIVAGSVNPEASTTLSGGSITAIIDHGVTSNMDMRYRVERRFEDDY